MPLGLRALLPVFALAAGSWVGLDPQARTKGADLAHGLATQVTSYLSFGRGRGSIPSPGAPPTGTSADGPAERPPTVDPTLLPDPTPWPQLNPEINAGRAWVIAEGPLQRPGDGRRLVTFTFDDGPFPETTPVVLHVLAKHGVRGTFFWIGRYLDGDTGRAVATRAVAKQVAAAGHLIGNHTHDHRLLLNLSRSEQIAQIDDGASSIERATGKRPVLFRPPFGQLDLYSEALLRTRGQTLVLWSVEAGDMKSADADAMFESLRDQIDYAGGGIVLLHDIRFSSADTLDKLLVWLDARRFDPQRPDRVGYQVVDLPSYLRAVAESPQPYSSRDELERARAAAWRKLHPHAGVPAAMISEEPAM
jgi:peptidoglycan/xylan/chitin deacetylase (PgdA/CDA1 family)